MEEGIEEGEFPLLSSAFTAEGTASQSRTLGNIIVSIVGTGILGLPFAFKVSGWLAGSIGVALAGIATCYCMLLLVQCRTTLASKGPFPEARTYGDIGFLCLGKPGRIITETLVVVAQCGGAVAYLVFIGQNLQSVFADYKLSFFFFMFILVPIEIILSWIESLSSLAIVSIFADICNVLAISTVIKQDFQRISSSEFIFLERKAVADDLKGMLFAVGTAVFCFEGFAMTLALESSMQNRRKFGSLLSKAFSGITLVYIFFAFSGYMAYGDQTLDVICLNLPHDWSSIAVQLGLCLAITCTFPMMVHPIHEIVEGKIRGARWFEVVGRDDGGSTKGGTFVVYGARSVVIVGLAAVACYVPEFGVFASFVGSTVCAMLSFVLPAVFHFTACRGSAPLWRIVLDSLIFVCGVFVAVYGTYNAIVGTA